MARVFLTHSPEMLRNYYGERAVAALGEFAEVVINPTGRVLDAEALTAHAQGCEIVVSDRQTPGFAAFFERAPDLVAFLRCAVDIRNVDVEAASREGILVTRATPGFAASVAELGMGFMIDLARGVSSSVGDVPGRDAAGGPRRAAARRSQRGPDRLWPHRAACRAARAGVRHDGAGQRSLQGPSLNRACRPLPSSR
jgi:phosphoglycerate dehydrogenase-like enzyme